MRPEPDLGLELGPGLREQHDLLVGVNHAADVLGKATFEADVHRADQAAGRELPGVAGVEENRTLARVLARGVDRHRGRVLVLAESSWASRFRAASYAK